MMQLFIILSLWSFLESPIKREDKDKVCWRQDHLLSWKDFKGKPSKIGDHEATSSIRIHYDVVSSNTILITNCLLKKESWVKKGDQTPELLLHEQYHFNLSEVFTRKMRKEMSTIKEIDAVVIQGIYDKWTQLCHYEQVLYDKETSHAQIITEQVNWQSKIDQELDSLKNYQNEVIYLSE